VLGWVGAVPPREKPTLGWVLAAGVPPRLKPTKSYI